MVSKFLFPKEREIRVSHLQSVTLKGNQPCLSDSLLTVSVCNLLSTSYIPCRRGSAGIGLQRGGNHQKNQALQLGLTFTQLRHLHSQAPLGNGFQVSTCLYRWTSETGHRSCNLKPSTSPHHHHQASSPLA